MNMFGSKCKRHCSSGMDADHMRPFLGLKRTRKTKKFGMGGSECPSTRRSATK